MQLPHELGSHIECLSAINARMAGVGSWTEQCSHNEPGARCHHATTANPLGEWKLNHDSYYLWTNSAAAACTVRIKAAQQHVRCAPLQFLHTALEQGFFECVSAPFLWTHSDTSSQQARPPTSPCKAAQVWKPRFADSLKAWRPFHTHRQMKLNIPVLVSLSCICRSFKCATEHASDPHESRCESNKSPK